MIPVRRSRDRWVPGRDPLAVRHAPPAPSPDGRLDRVPTAVVVGGGIAGLAAATGLAERGVRGDPRRARRRRWAVGSAPGRSTRRRDGDDDEPRLPRVLPAVLQPARAAASRPTPPWRGCSRCADYPLVLAGGHTDSFAGHPARRRRSTSRPSWRAAPASPLRDLARVDVGAASELLDVGFPRDLRRLRRARAPRSSSTGCGSRRRPGISRSRCSPAASSPTRASSPAASWSRCSTPTSSGRPRGCCSTCPYDDYDTALWAPLGRYLDGLGVRGAHGPRPRRRWTDRGRPSRCGSRTARRGGRRGGAGDRPDDRCSGSSRLARGWATRRGASGSRPSRTAPPFAVWRLWLDRPVRDRTPPFLGHERVRAAGQRHRRWTSSRPGRAGGPRRTGGSRRRGARVRRCPTAPTRPRCGSSCATELRRSAPGARPRRPCVARGVAGPRRLPAGRHRAVARSGPRSRRRTRGGAGRRRRSAATTRSR